MVGTESSRRASECGVGVLDEYERAAAREAGLNPDDPAVAAAMDHQVDVLCTATAGKLMLKGVAEKLVIKPGDPKTVYDWIKEAHDQGAKFWACPANLELFDKSEADLIPECAGLMGAAAMIQDVMDGECRVLTF